MIKELKRRYSRRASTIWVGTKSSHSAAIKRTNQRNQPIFWSKIIMGFDYHFDDIKSKNSLHWIWHSIIAWWIDKSREITGSNKMICCFSHYSSIEFMSNMVCIQTLKWIHDSIIKYLVVISLSLGRKSSMELRNYSTNFSNTNVRRKKTIESCMNAIQAVIIERCNKVCHLES